MQSGRRIKVGKFKMMAANYTQDTSNSSLRQINEA